ncbi:MAG: hypothetical protein HYS26_00430 [Candidatus Kaiserbacteria bacterium]|nr:MAG: hypothetical protein HYS26_00430 [Candidatus Kaiserbacteria bacterium]
MIAIYALVLAAALGVGYLLYAETTTMPQRVFAFGLLMLLMFVYTAWRQDIRFYYGYEFERSAHVIVSLVFYGIGTPIVLRLLPAFWRALSRSLHI